MRGLALATLFLGLCFFDKDDVADMSQFRKFRFAVFFGALVLIVIGL
jgi:hypothetical protein